MGARPAIPLANVHSTSATGGANILGSDIAPQRSASAFRITVGTDTAAVFSVRIDDGTEVGYNFNGGTELTADALYTFTMSVHTDYTYNFRVSVTGTLNLLVEEIQSGEL